ncbi:hypothetical protein DVH24_019808 [Malus domestica]|uniref:Uncharacterized protein n=1 Tax=Malus domestica TaxID=3750 RepID=A0A498I1C9_MALDO|nr:hypothetical protein DVH24_019808 [Malus domestica]
MSHPYPTNSGENNPKPSENVEDIRRQESREFGKRETSLEVVLKLHFETDYSGSKALYEVSTSISDDRACII